jgi:hypothetical protein
MGQGVWLILMVKPPSDSSWWGQSVCSSSLPAPSVVSTLTLFHLIRASPLVQGVELSFALSWRHLDFTSGLALLWRFAPAPCFHNSTHPRPRIRYSFPRAGDRHHACRPKTKTDEGLPWQCDELALALSRRYVGLMPGFVLLSHFALLFMRI